MNLQLSLTEIWFRKTESLIKKEDYRNITPHWCNRFLLYNSQQMSKSFWAGYLETTGGLILSDCSFKPFTQNTMTLGYPSKTDTARILKFEHEGIEIRTGNPEWGAEPNKLYFVIKHGKKL